MTSFPQVNMTLAAGTCSMCGRPDVPTVAGVTPEAHVRGVFEICEPCALMVGWMWRQQAGHDPPGSIFPREPTRALVLLVKPRFIKEDLLGGGEKLPDPDAPFDVFMVPRKEEAGTDAFELPGVHVPRGMPVAAAAASGLLVSTSIHTWATALEHLYTGFDARGELRQVFLCRAYAEDDGSRRASDWRPWPPSAHAGARAGFYAGVELAFQARLALNRAHGFESPVCQPMGLAAVQHVTAGLEKDLIDEATRRLLEGLSYVMSDDEKAAAKLVLRDRVEGHQRSLTIARARERAVEKQRQAPRAAAPAGEDDVAFDDGDEGREGPE